MIFESSWPRAASTMDGELYASELTHTQCVAYVASISVSAHTTTVAIYENNTSSTL